MTGRASRPASGATTARPDGPAFPARPDAPAPPARRDAPAPPARLDAPAGARSRPTSLRIWAYAGGYFASYVPYALLTRMLADGGLPGSARPVAGLSILPLTTAVSALGMILLLAGTGLWRRAGHVPLGPLAVPVPRLATALSGAATAAIVLTTTLAYTVPGAGVVTMMLLMRGGVLVLAPIVDLAFRRPIRRASWAALGLSLAAVAMATGSGAGATLGAEAAIVVSLYLLAYFGRLALMARFAKEDDEAGLRYFVEEQLVATPFALLLCGAMLALGPAAMRAELAGAASVGTSGAMPWIVLVGLASQGTGIFGALVLVDGREHAFSVPVNRAASVVAGVAAAVLAIGLGGPGPSAPELAGATLVLSAIAVLAISERRPKPPALSGAGDGRGSG